MRRDDWETHAEDWLAWARTPGHDAYWHYRDSFFDHVLAPPGAATLEVGCGEGRVARDLASRGHRVVAVDRAPTLLSAARRADPAGCYLPADGTELPFAARTFDQVVAYNSLMDIEDMPGAIREVGRVLRPGGTFSVCITHPLFDAGHFTDENSFVIKRPYLETSRFEETFERDGLTMTFCGWTHPLSAYADALEAAALQVTRVREPAPGGTGASYERWRRVPMFLHLRAVKP